jgi:bifunctional UDP-N-acetylglucosamine pyrophosphorylase / glucosamine-1-phosphate N-acetyltransferase
VRVALTLSDYVADFPALASAAMTEPWDLCADAATAITIMLARLDRAYRVAEGVAVHETAIVEPSMTLKPPCIIGPNCFVASYCYLRGGVYLAEGVTVGPGVEIKSSFIGTRSALAHLNFIGNSIVGSDVNIEAGAVIANHRNERADKSIRIAVDGEVVTTRGTTFGAVVGDRCRIGANAVLLPGTILKPGTIIDRLTLVDQEPKPRSGR